MNMMIAVYANFWKYFHGGNKILNILSFMLNTHLDGTI